MGVSEIFCNILWQLSNEEKDMKQLLQSSFQNHLLCLIGSQPTKSQSPSPQAPQKSRWQEQLIRQNFQPNKKQVKLKSIKYAHMLVYVLGNMYAMVIWDSKT